MKSYSRPKIIKQLLFVLLICIQSILFAQDKTTTYKNKSGNTTGHSKQKGNTTTYYNKSGNKTGSSKSTEDGTTTFYNKQGNKSSTSKTK